MSHIPRAPDEDDRVSYFRNVQSRKASDKNQKVLSLSQESSRQPNVNKIKDPKRYEEKLRRLVLVDPDRESFDIKGNGPDLVSKDNNVESMDPRTYESLENKKISFDTGSGSAELQETNHAQRYKDLGWKDTFSNNIPSKNMDSSFEISEDYMPSFGNDLSKRASHKCVSELEHFDSSDDSFAVGKHKIQLGGTDDQQINFNQNNVNCNSSDHYIDSNNFNIDGSNENNTDRNWHIDSPHSHNESPNLSDNSSGKDPNFSDDDLKSIFSGGIPSASDFGLNLIPENYEYSDNSPESSDFNNIYTMITPVLNIGSPAVDYISVDLDLNNLSDLEDFAFSSSQGETNRSSINSINDAFNISEDNFLQHSPSSLNLPGSETSRSENLSEIPQSSNDSTGLFSMKELEGCSEQFLEIYETVLMEWANELSEQIISDTWQLLIIELQRDIAWLGRH